MTFNPHHDPVARELHDVNVRLQGVNDHLWELSQPPEVRTELQTRRDEQARALVWGLRAVAGILAASYLATKLFGPAGSNLVAGALGLVWKGFEVVLVFGLLFYLPYVVGRVAWRGLRRLAGRPEGGL